MLNLAIVGAGPYGLSVAAYMRRQGITYRIFGRPMDSWAAHMPKGMMLKSEGFASNINDPNGEFTLKQFCAERKIDYSDIGMPVHLETFTAYGLAFRERMVPELEDKLVVGVDRVQDGFVLKLDDGELVKARRVILAVGITHFQNIPENLAHLPAEYLSHSYRHRDLEEFRGRKVVVLGGGSSATDLAGLLQESGAEVRLVSRDSSLKFHNKPEIGKPRSLWQQIRHPQSGLGPGLKSRFYANSPLLFRLLSQRTRLDIVRTHLGPSGGWFIKDKIMGKVPLLLGYSPKNAEIRQGKVHLELCQSDGSNREVIADHVIAATGYRVDLKRLKFLSEEIRSGLKTESGTPVLSSSFESSVPGLYFVGVAAANSFGPVMRFAFGARFAAKHITSSFTKSLSRSRSVSPSPQVIPAKNEETGAI
ncbi:MAG: NAD(P)-binding domain-containing protein [Candidatus Acidiferrum sp.]